MLQGHWHFQCRCRRCEDPTELGSMLGALRCRRKRPDDKEGRQQQQCPGSLLPDRPSDPLSSSWTCDACAGVVGSREAEVVLRVSEERIRWNVHVVVVALTSFQVAVAAVVVDAVILLFVVVGCCFCYC